MSDADRLKSILILDDDADFRKLLTTILSKRFEDVTLTEYDPAADGVPDENFNWSRYDVLLLDYHLSIPRTTGLDILQNNRKNKLFPATIMLTGAGNEEVAVRAVKAGVYDYMRKEYLDKDRLQSAIIDAFEKHQVERDKLNELTSQSHAFNKALFYQELEQRNREKNNRALILIELDRHEALELRLGIIFRDNIIRHIAKQSFDVFKMADCNPSITRFGDASVAILIDEPKSRKALEFNLEGLCAHLEKHPYKYNGKKISATVSVGAICLSDKQLNAEDYINHALIAVDKAAAEEGDSFYLYSDADWQAKITSLPEKHVAFAEEQEVEETEAETEPLLTPEPEPKSEPKKEQKPAIEKKAEPEPKDVAETTEPEQAEGEEIEAAGEGGKPKLEGKALAELLQTVKTAFDEKRAVQTFQPMISLTHEEDDQEIYTVSVQLINKDGTIMSDDDLEQVEEVPAFRKFLDRWMLREIIGRLVSRQHEQYLFFMNISAESIADATFFNWLRKVLKDLDKNSPGKQIILEISAKEIMDIQKQTSALMSFFKKSHGFRFALAQATEIQQIRDLTKSMHFDVIRAGYQTFEDMSTNYPDMPAGTGETEEKISYLQLLINNGVSMFVDDLGDATKLTQAISLGIDYGSGPFIGEPMNQLDDVTNVESFEII